MISKAKSTKGSSQAIDYIMNDKGQAIELDRNLVSGMDGKEILKEMRTVQSQNLRCEKNTFSIVLSPSPDREYSVKELKEYLHKHLENLKLQENQWIATVHNSTGIQHIHIIANRIDKSGKALPDNFISKKAQNSAEKIAIEKGLTVARDIQNGRSDLFKSVKQNIAKAHNFSNAKSFDQYRKQMNDNGIEVKIKLNTKLQAQGMKFLHKETGLEFKSSEIGKQYGIKNLQERGMSFPFQLNSNYTKESEQQKTYNPQYVRNVEEAINSGKFKPTKEHNPELNKKEDKNLDHSL